MTGPKYQMQCNLCNVQDRKAPFLRIQNHVAQTQPAALPLPRSPSLSEASTSTHLYSPYKARRDTPTLCTHHTNNGNTNGHENAV